MQRRSVWTTVGLALACAVLAWALWPPAAPPSGGSRSAGVRSQTAAEPAPESPPALAPVAAALPEEPEVAVPEWGDPPEEVEPARLSLIEADERLSERARQQRLAAEADARWHEAVDGSGYTADDFDPAIRSLFQNISLEPRYAEGGRIEGLVIEDIVDEHPLARLGFQRGDRIDRIQGVPLRDPADLPSLLSHLGLEFSVCAERDGAELCREVVLE